jgi:pyruvate dehydrogenase E2 component (dihydrolipoamide acetyltransferase)
LTEFKVPELGENVDAADVARVLVNVGDTIKREQPVIELETDKATIEVPSSVAGIVKEIKVKKGEKIKVGAVVLTVDDAGAGNGAPAGKAAAPTAQPGEEPAPPGEAEPPAEAPKAQEPADHKVLSMPPRPSAGAGRPELVEGRAAAAVPRGDAAETREQEAAPAAPAPRAQRGPAAPAAPSVRRLAREIGVDINDVQGSGTGGRISLDDVKEHARRILTSVGAAGAGAPAAGPARASRALPDFSKWGEVERQPWSNIRRVTAEHLSYSWNAIPHVTQFDKADVTSLEELRKKYKGEVEKAGGNLTVTAMLVRILATAVKKFPQFNASIDPERGEIVFKKFTHIGVAVDTDRGLLVPIIRDADRKNITQIAVELQQLAQKARDRKLSVEDMSGGSMTISNLGGIGGTYFTPIVNWPEVAILGVSRGVIEPVWNSATNAFEPRQKLPLSLSYDHRVIDGADAMRFLRWVVEAIEQPFLLSLIG